MLVCSMCDEAMENPKGYQNKAKSNFMQRQCCQFDRAKVVRTLALVCHCCIVRMVRWVVLLFW